MVGWWLPAATEVPIRIGEVEIASGDYMLGDRDGMLRIPRDMIEQVVALAEEAMGTESAIRTAIEAGMDPQAAYLEFGKF